MSTALRSKAPELTTDRVAARLVFPVEALENKPFFELYDGLRSQSDEFIDSQEGEVTLTHPTLRCADMDSLQDLLKAAELPYNLYRDIDSATEVLHYWRPGMTEFSISLHPELDALADPTFSLSIRRACEERVYGQTSIMEFGC